MAKCKFDVKYEFFIGIKIISYHIMQHLSLKLNVAVWRKRHKSLTQKKIEIWHHDSNNCYQNLKEVKWSK